MYIYLQSRNQGICSRLTGLYILELATAVRDTCHVKETAIWDMLPYMQTLTKGNHLVVVLVAGMSRC